MKINFKILYRANLRTKLLAILGLAFLVTISFINSAGTGGLPQGDADNGGLALPGDFEAVVVADSLGRARHLAVNKNGDIYVKLRVPDAQKRGSVALRDNNNDGKADIIKYFGNYPDTGNYGTAMRIHKGYLYYSTAGEVLRTKLTPGKLVPEGKTETIVVDNYKRGKSSHIAKPIAFDNKGNMYVPFGSPSDVCQIDDRQPGSMGQMPCPELKEHGGVWKFSESKLNQKQSDGTMYATGIRSIVGMAWNNVDNSLYAMQHGRDDLSRTWSNLFTSWHSALLPSEEFLKVPEGSDSGWPYYYYDFMQGKKLLNPEYGGDGKKEGAASKYNMPIIGFPGHFAPNDLLFYTGNQFPERYKNGAFVAFHGSTIRAPYPQAGYCVAFVPFKNGKFSSEWELFADGFGGVDTIVYTSDAKYRPMGLAQGPDGSLYMNDSEKGKIWRVMFKGDKNKFGTSQLAGMAARKLTSPNVKSPDFEKDNLMKGQLAAGAKLYNTYCATCHQLNGKGDGTRFPPVAESEWVNGDRKRLIELVLNGLSGPITVKGVGYNEAMPPHGYLKDTEIAQILTYVRSNFGNSSSAITANEVSRYRTKR